SDTNQKLNSLDYRFLLDAQFPASGSWATTKIDSSAVASINKKSNDSANLSTIPSRGDPGRPYAAAAGLLFLGLPPERPLRWAAAALAALVDLPPSAPRRLAIHFLEPRKPSRSAGRYRSA